MNMKQSLMLQIQKKSKVYYRNLISNYSLLFEEENDSIHTVFEKVCSWLALLTTDRLDRRSLPLA